MQNESKNVILAVVLSIGVLAGWSMFGPQPAQPVASNVQVQGERPVQNQSIEDARLEETFDTRALTAKQAISSSATVIIDTPKLHGSIALTGAKLNDLILKKYNETTDPDSANIRLLAPRGTAEPYFVESGWIGVKGSVPTSKTVWTANGDKLTVNTPVTLTFTNSEGVVFKKVYTIDENYMVSLKHVVVNNSTSAIALADYGLVARTYVEKGGPPIYILHEGPIGVLDEKLREIDYDDLKDDGKEVYTSKGGWVGITDQYWLVSLAPEQDKNITATYRYINRGAGLYQADFKNEKQIITPGETKTFGINIFAGAKEVDVIDYYEEKFGIPKFDLSIDFGWFYFLTKPFFKVLHYFSSVFGNVGVAIIVFTVLIKAILFPLASKSYRSMAKMKVLAPRMEEMKKRFKDDRAGMQKAMMAMYKEEKVNPMSGCLPMLIQIPIFFSLYKVLYVTLEMRHAPFFGWITDLSAPDPLGILTGFGLFSWSVPASIAFLNIGVWPLFMGFSMWLQQRLNPTPQDPIQAKVFGLMPIMFTFLLATFPAGLVIYWTWNNLLSISQQYYIQKKIIS